MAHGGICVALGRAVFPSSGQYSICKDFLACLVNLIRNFLSLLDKYLVACFNFEAME